MCLQAKDTDEEPVYFGGWQALALSLGYPDPQPGTAAERAVSRAIAELVRACFVSANPESRGATSADIGSTSPRCSPLHPLPQKAQDRDRTEPSPSSGGPR